MARYRVEQYELHAMSYEVDAPNALAAVRAVLAGTVPAIDNSLEYVEIPEDCGMPASSLPLAGWSLPDAAGLFASYDDTVPSIRDVVCVDEEDPSDQSPDSD